MPTPRVGDPFKTLQSLRAGPAPAPKAQGVKPAFDDKGDPLRERHPDSPFLSFDSADFERKRLPFGAEEGIRRLPYDLNQDIMKKRGIMEGLASASDVDIRNFLIKNVGDFTTLLKPREGFKGKDYGKEDRKFHQEGILELANDPNTTKEELLEVIRFQTEMVAPTLRLGPAYGYDADGSPVSRKDFLESHGLDSAPQDDPSDFLRRRMRSIWKDWRQPEKHPDKGAIPSPEFLLPKNKGKQLGLEFRAIQPGTGDEGSSPADFSGEGSTDADQAGIDVVARARAKQIKENYSLRDIVHALLARGEEPKGILDSVEFVREYMLSEGDGEAEFKAKLFDYFGEVLGRMEVGWSENMDTISFQPEPDSGFDLRGGGSGGDTLTKFAPLTSKVVGQTEEGRNIYRNEDGTESSERSITVKHPDINSGAPTNIPSIFKGKELSEKEAVRVIDGSGGKDPETGRVLPGFATIKAAVAAANARSKGLKRKKQNAR
jgi:hypothetical protein